METGPDVRQRAFYPDYLSEILVVIFLTIGAVFILAVTAPPSLDREINFVAAYQPKPEWYFLWMYQLVRYFPGRWAFIGTVMVPLAACALLISMPFIGNGAKRSSGTAALLFSILAAAVFILTMVPVLWP